jgi:hypothetical protein
MVLGLCCGRCLLIYPWRISAGFSERAIVHDDGVRLSDGSSDAAGPIRPAAKLHLARSADRLGRSFLQGAPQPVWRSSGVTGRYALGTMLGNLMGIGEWAGGMLGLI